MIYYVCWKNESNEATFQRKIGLARGLAKAGVSVTILFLMPGSPLNTIPRTNGLHYHQLGFKIFRKFKFLYYLSSLFAINKIVKDGDSMILPDQPVFSLVVLRRFRNIKKYIEISENPEIKYSDSFIGKWQLKQYKKSVLVCDAIFVMTKNLKKWHLSLGVKQSQVIVINMTVDISRFKGIIKTEERKKIVYCGTATNQKDGICILVDAFGFIAKQFENVDLYIYGKIPLESDRNEIKCIEKKWAIEDRVHYMGVVSGEEIPQILVNAELLVLARPQSIQAKYGFPTKVGEYLLSGNPVVLTNVGELHLFLKDGENCFFAKPDSVDSFAKKMTDALLSPNLKKIGENGRKVVLKYFNADIEAKKMIPLLTCSC